MMLQGKANGQELKMKPVLVPGFFFLWSFSDLKSPTGQHPVSSPAILCLRWEQHICRCCHNEECEHHILCESLFLSLWQTLATSETFGV